MKYKQWKFFINNEIKKKFYLNYFYVNLSKLKNFKNIIKFLSSIKF